MKLEASAYKKYDREPKNRRINACMYGCITLLYHALTEAWDPLSPLLSHKPLFLPFGASPDVETQCQQGNADA